MVLSGFLVAGMRAAGKLKSFSVQQFFKTAAEVWASSSHLRSKLFCNKFSLLQLHFLTLCTSNKVKQYESKLQIRTRQRGNCVRFGRIASLSAFVLFAGGYVIRIIFQSFLDYSLQEVSMFSKQRTAVYSF